MIRKLKEFLKKESDIYPTGSFPWEQLIIRNSELKNQIIEILMESGECEWIRQRGLGINCSEIKNENKTYDFISCRYCQGQEKINKLLEG